jgi:hypothetical protein
MIKKSPPTGDISELDRYIYISICLYKTNSTASFHLDSLIPLGSHHLQQNLVGRTSTPAYTAANEACPCFLDWDFYCLVFPHLTRFFRECLPRYFRVGKLSGCKGITEGDVVAVVRFGPATRFMGSFGLDLLSSLSDSISSSNSYLHACHIANVSLVVLHGEFGYHFRPVRRVGTNLKF